MLDAYAAVESDPDDEELNIDEIADEIARMLSRVGSKHAGRESTTRDMLEDMLLSLLVKRRSKVNWRDMLRRVLLDKFRRAKKTTWKKLSRRLPYLMPGYYRETWHDYPEIYLLLDVSGSVVSDEAVLDQFLAELMAIADLVKAKLRVVLWDTEVREVIDPAGRSPQELAQEIKRRALLYGGGTVIDPALRYYIENGGGRSALIILSDGYWNNYDKTLFAVAAAKALQAIYCYTGREHRELEQHGWITIPLTDV